MYPTASFNVVRGIIIWLRVAGMEERVSRLEKELANHLATLPPHKQEDETSSDGGIESGTEADDFSEK